MKNLSAVSNDKDIVTKEYVDTADGLDRALVAPVEASTTASQAHGLGQCFVMGGVLYRALADISVGDTITVGTNAVQTNIAQNFTRTVQLTANQYSLLSSAEKNADILYVITDDQGTSGLANKADKTDLASIQASGSTNATGATIASGTYFYLNGSLVLAKADIASGASFTENTNYETVTAGGLNSLKAAMIFSVEIPNSDFTFNNNSSQKCFVCSHTVDYYIPVGAKFVAGIAEATNGGIMTFDYRQNTGAINIRGCAVSGTSIVALDSTYTCRVKLLYTLT